MTASRADRAGTPAARRSAALAALTLSAFLCGSAAGQGLAPGPPLRLVPDAPPAPALPPAESTASPKLPSILVDELAAPDPDGAGLLAPGQGGLGIALWSGMPRADVLDMLARLPVTMPSPAGRALMKRLLLTEAAAPQAGVDEPPPARSYGSLRVEALARMGDPYAALDLAAVLPDALADEAAARAVVDAQLLQGALDCPVAAALAKRFGGTGWRRLDVFCRARDGDADGTRLALDVLEEQGDRDESFQQLAEAMADRSALGIAAPKSADALTLAMLRALAVPVPPESLTPADPARLVAIARNTAADRAARVAAAETAALHLFLDTPALTEAYRAAPARGDEPNRLRDLAMRERGARVRGLVLQAFDGAADGNRRIALAALALTLLDPPMLAGPSGAVVAGMLDTLSPTRAAAPLARDAVRLYAAQGRPDAARRWLDLAVGNGDGPRLWPLAAIALGTAPEANAAGATAWLDEELRSAGPEAASGTLDLLKALGTDIPEEAVQRLADLSIPLPAGPLFERLEAAEVEERVGEAVLTALLVMGEAGPAGTPPAAMARIVTALRAVGLDAEARALARESVAARPG